jgi:hypothetical protein
MESGRSANGSSEDFHAQNERGVKQEIFAHFALVTMNRIFANQADDNLNPFCNPIDEKSSHENSEPKPSSICLNIIKTNFKNCIHVFTKSIEELIFVHGKIKTAVERAFHFLIECHWGRGGGRASALLPLLDDVPASPASRRLASARPALATKCKCYSFTGPYSR